MGKTITNETAEMMFNFGAFITTKFLYEQNPFETKDDKALEALTNQVNALTRQMFMAFCDGTGIEGVETDSE